MSNGRVRAISGASGLVLWEVQGSQPGVPGQNQGENFGWAVSFLDWDADGVEDVALSAPRYCATPCSLGYSTRSGRIAIHRGQDGTQLANLIAPDLGGLFGGDLQSFGNRLASGADLTGDGIVDLVTCAVTWSPSTSLQNSGGVFVIETPTGSVVGGVPGTMPLETPGSFGTYGEWGRLFVHPGSVPGTGPLIGVGSPSTYSSSLLDIGSVRLYQPAIGLLPLAGQQQGTQAYERFGSAVVSGEDCTGDGIPDCAVLSWPNTPPPPLLVAPPPRVTLYSGASFQPLWQVLLIPGLAIARGVEMIGDQDGDSTGEVVVSRGGGGGSAWVEIRSGPSGTTLSSWSFPPTGEVYRANDLGDVNGDGWEDVGIGQAASGFGAFPYGRLQVFGRRNLTMAGTPAPGAGVTFSVSAPKCPSRPFVLLFSLSSAPPITVGSFSIPLVLDPLFLGSLAAGLVASLDGAGNGALTLVVPPDPALSGLSVFASGVVIDGGFPFGIATILTKLALTIA